MVIPRAGCASGNQSQRAGLSFGTGDKESATVLTGTNKMNISLATDTQPPYGVAAGLQRSNWMVGGPAWYDC